MGNDRLKPLAGHLARAPATAFPGAIFREEVEERRISRPRILERPYFPVKDKDTADRFPRRPSIRDRALRELSPARRYKTGERCQLERPPAQLGRWQEMSLPPRPSSVVSGRDIWGLVCPRPVRVAR